MAVCSFLCFCRLFSTAEAAVYMFSMKRCPPGIWPSHKRYHGTHFGLSHEQVPPLGRRSRGCWELGRPEGLRTEVGNAMQAGGGGGVSCALLNLGWQLEGRNE